MEKGHSSLKRNFWRCNTQQCASRLHLCLEPRDAIWTTLAHLACTDVSSCLSLKLISCSSALCSHGFSDKDCGQNMLIPAWMMSCRHSNRSSIISPWIRNRTLHWLWKIKLFFLPGQLPHISSSPLAGRNNYRWATYPFVSIQFRKGHLILDHAILLSVPQLLTRSWVHSKQMPKHTPLHQHCKRLLGSLALSRVTSTAR